MEKEIWKPVVGYLGFYEVSNLGNVRSLSRLLSTGEYRKGIQLNCPIDRKGNGYIFANLSKNGIVKKKTVHVLVLEAFAGPRPNIFAQARHMDGNKTNPRLDNLQWGTPKQNADDKITQGRAQRGENSSRKVLTKEFVQWIRESKQSSIALSKMFDVASSTIRAIRIGQNWKYD